MPFQILQTIDEIFFGTWPTTAVPLMTATEKGSNRLPFSRRHGGYSPDILVHMVLSLAPLPRIRKKASWRFAFRLGRSERRSLSAIRNFLWYMAYDGCCSSGQPQRRDQIGCHFRVDMAVLHQQLQPRHPGTEPRKKASWRLTFRPGRGERRSLSAVQKFFTYENFPLYGTLLHHACYNACTAESIIKKIKKIKK